MKACRKRSTPERGRTSGRSQVKGEDAKGGKGGGGLVLPKKGERSTIRGFPGSVKRRKGGEF